MGRFLFFDIYIKSFPSYFGQSFSISNRKFFSVIKNHVTKLPTINILTYFNCMIMNSIHKLI